MIGFTVLGKHNRLRALLSSYVDGEVSPAEAGRVERHLAGCDECRRERDSLEATVGLLKQLPELQVNRSFTLQAEPVALPAPRPFAWATGLATSAAAVLLVALLLGDGTEILTQSRDVSPIQVEALQETAPAAVPTPAAAMAAAAAPVAAMAQDTAPQDEEQAVAPMMAAAAPAPPETDEETPKIATARAAPAPQALEQEGEAAATEDEPAEEAAALVAAADDGSIALYTSEPPSDGFELPLWQLETAAGGLVLVLLAATLWLVVRARRRPF